MLGSLELHCNGKLAVMSILTTDFEHTGAGVDETEDLVSEAMRLGSVEAVVLLVEQSDCVRASLRSRRGLDIAGIARRFGGGGHAQAAGCRGNEPIAAFKKRLIEAFGETLFAVE
jgi:phosphoesterase RecJ-like protein